MRISKTRRILAGLAGALAAVLLMGCGICGKSDVVFREKRMAGVSIGRLPMIRQPDGNREDITCKGSYYGDSTPSEIVAEAGGYQLTAGMLNLLYAMEVAESGKAEGPRAPVLLLGLDRQMCGIPGQEHLTWQQHLLQKALNTWHSCIGLVEKSKQAHMPLDPEYSPYPRIHELYLQEDLPLIPYLYGWDTSYRINRLHQDYMDDLPERLEALGGADALAKAMGGNQEELLALGELLNQAYGYYAFDRFHQSISEEEMALRGSTMVSREKTVTFRHVLLTGEDRESRAQELMEEIQKDAMTEAEFGALANQWSQDLGTKACGGLYTGVPRGTLAKELEEWLFDSIRMPGDHAVVKSSVGTHIVWFRCVDGQLDEAENVILQERSMILVEGAKRELPMTVHYDRIRLKKPDGELGITLSDILYPDIAHEEIPDVPCYLQQDYPHSDYGLYNLASYGCGITTLAMLASYMTDEYLTPPVMADRYGSYCLSSGTNTELMIDSAWDLGYYVDSVSFDWHDARDAMERGLMVISLQHKGHFTGGGHYLLLRNLNEDGTVAICDSNLFNYSDVRLHKTNHFPWWVIGEGGVMYWAYQPKLTSTGACARCGDGSAPAGLLMREYTCGKCRTAIERRTNFLALIGQ